MKVEIGMIVLGYFDEKDDLVEVVLNNLISYDLSGLHLHRISNAQPYNCSFENAENFSANFSNSNLRSSRFRNSKFVDCNFDNTIFFGNLRQ